MTENTHMSVVGDGVFKMYRYLDGVLRQFAVQKADFPHFVSHAWLSSDLLVAGTVSGRLIVMDSTEYKREYVIFPDDPPESKFVPLNSAILFCSRYDIRVDPATCKYLFIYLFTHKLTKIS